MVGNEQIVTVVSNWPSGFTIDTSNPIAKIELWSGWVIDAITVTYRLADGSWKAVKHGANVTPSRVIELGRQYLFLIVFFPKLKWLDWSQLTRLSPTFVDGLACIHTTGKSC